MSGKGRKRTMIASLRQHVRANGVLVALFFVTWALGTWGFEAARCKSDPVDSGYRALQLFGLNYDALGACKLSSGVILDGKNWQIEIARYLGGFVLVFAFLLLLGTQIRDWLKLQWQSRARRKVRVVLLGFGSVNTALARLLGERGVPVTVVSKVFTEADRALARQYGALLITGDLTDADTLARARTGAAGHIVVAAGDDVMNVEIGTAAAAFAEAARRRNPDPGLERFFERAILGRCLALQNRKYGCDAGGRPVVKIHLTSTRTLADLSEGRDIAYARGAAADLFSVKTDAAQKLVREARFTRKALDRGQERVHIVFAGMGDQGEALMTEIYLNAFAARLTGGTADVLKAPRFTIIDVDPDKDVEARLMAHRPRLFDTGAPVPDDARPTFDYIAADAKALCFDLNEKLSAIEDQCPVTAWIFTCGNDDVNLAAGFRLEMAMHQLKRDPAPIFMRLWSADIIDAQGHADAALEPRSPLLFTSVFGSVNTVMPEARVLAHLMPDKAPQRLAFSDEEELAVLLHNQYGKEAEKLNALMAKGAAGTAEVAETRRRYMDEWKNLPTNVKETNRRAIRHAAVKLADMGFDWPVPMVRLEEAGSGRVRVEPLLLPRLDRQTADALRALIPLPDQDGKHKDTPFVPELNDRHIPWLEAIGLTGDPGNQAVREEAGRYLDAISMSEHSRWMADRAIDGWQSGERDNRRRLHDNMIAYGRLGTIKALDQTAVRMLLAYLSSEADPNRARRPQARLRRVARIEIQDEQSSSIPPDADLASATELRIVVHKKAAEAPSIAPDQAESLSRAVESWSKAETAARLHIELSAPIELAITAMAKDNQPAAVLKRIAMQAAHRVTVDVTRTYRRATDKQSRLARSGGADRVAGSAAAKRRRGAPSKPARNAERKS